MFLFMSDFTIRVAQVSNLETPLIVESLDEIPYELNGDDTAELLRNAVKGKEGKYLMGACGVAFCSQFLHKLKLENKYRSITADAFPEILKERFNVNVEENSVAVISGETGQDYNPETDTSKDILFCGALTSSFRERQSLLVSANIFPVRLELGIIGSIGSILSYANQIENKDPFLFIDIDSHKTQVLILKEGQVEVAHAIQHGFNAMLPHLQRSLKFHDESSTKEALYSGSLSNTEESQTLALEKIVKELKSYTGFYEVQTGRTINHVYFNGLSQRMDWIAQHLAEKLYLQLMAVDFSKWLPAQKISCDQSIKLENLHSSWLTLFSLMSNVIEKTPDVSIPKESK